MIHPYACLRLVVLRLTENHAWRHRYWQWHLLSDRPLAKPRFPASGAHPRTIAQDPRYAAEPAFRPGHGRLPGGSHRVVAAMQKSARDLVNHPEARSGCQPIHAVLMVFLMVPLAM